MHVEKEWQGLKTALEKMVVDYTHFKGLALKQRRALIENDVPTLTTILTEMETVADSVFLMDDRRRMHMELLSEAGDREMVNLRELAELWPELDFKPLEEAAAKLRVLRQEIEALVKVNAALIRSSRNLIQATVEAIVQSPGANGVKPQKVYGANGAMCRDKTPVRNLLNKKG